MQWLASTLHTTSEHGVSSITTADAAHLCCQQSTELTPTGRFKWTRPFRAKDQICFLRVCHHISTGLYLSTNTTRRRSPLPRGLRRRYTASRLLGLRVRIPLTSWMSVPCECCVLSGRDIRAGMITLPQESYRVWSV